MDNSKQIAETSSNMVIFMIMDQGLLDHLPEVVLAVILHHLPVLVTYQQPIALVQAHPMRISLSADAHAFKQIIPKPKLSISLSQIGTAQPVLGNVVRLTDFHQSPSLIGPNCAGLQPNLFLMSQGTSRHNQILS